MQWILSMTVEKLYPRYDVIKQAFHAVTYTNLRQVITLALTLTRTPLSQKN